MIRDAVKRHWSQSAHVGLRYGDHELMNYFALRGVVSGQPNL